MIVAGMLLLSVGLAWFALIVTAGIANGHLILPLLIAGVGVSMVLPTSAATALGAVAGPDMGKAAGANSSLQRFGGVFGVALTAAVFAANGRLGTAASFAAGFRPALAVAAGLALLGAVTALAVGSRQRPAEVAQPEAAIAPAFN
ncbi:MAG: hypothetical protein ACR2PL_23270 [Dehalococcoidia bacterium]